MGLALSSRRNDNGGITFDLGDGRSRMNFELSRMPALQLASRILALLGLTSLVNNPDGTFTAR
jgi:hypothetical protein